MTCFSCTFSTVIFEPLAGSDMAGSCIVKQLSDRAVTRRDNWGGRGGIFIYSCSHTVKTIAFKRNPSGRTRIYEYTSLEQDMMIGLDQVIFWKV